MGSLRLNGWLAALALAVVALFVATGWIAAQRQLTSLESLLLQALVLVVGLAATLFAGYRSAQIFTADSTRQHARSAFRRVASLYAGYTRVGVSIARQRNLLAGAADADGRLPAELVSQGLDVLEAQMDEQFETLEDALADWRDLSPEGVAEIEAQMRKRLEP